MSSLFHAIVVESGLWKFAVLPAIATVAAGAEFVRQKAEARGKKTIAKVFSIAVNMMLVLVAVVFVYHWVASTHVDAPPDGCHKDPISEAMACK